MNSEEFFPGVREIDLSSEEDEQPRSKRENEDVTPTNGHEIGLHRWRRPYRVVLEVGRDGAVRQIIEFEK